MIVVRLICVAILGVLSACGPMPVAKSDAHLRNDSESSNGRHQSSAIPAPVRQVPLPPAPIAKAQELKYSVVVDNQSLREVLYAISRDTGVNIDIYPGLDGRVTINAIDQTLKQILNRLTKQLDARWETDGPNIAVMPDRPYLKLYKVDYVNLARESIGTVGVQTQVVGPGGQGSAGGASQNSSSVKIDNVSKNRFWESLEKNIKQILQGSQRDSAMSGQTKAEPSEIEKAQLDIAKSQLELLRKETKATTELAEARADLLRAQADRVRPRQSETQPAATVINALPSTANLTPESADVIVNAETGTLSIRATSRQHEKVAEFLAQIGGSSKRQVLIEATIVEVVLNDRYQSGVDWSAIGLEGLGYTIRQNFLAANLNEAPFFSLQYSNPNAAAGGNLSSTVKLLNSFGTTRVLSSPKIISLNNQTAVLKVVENQVYFTVQSTVVPATVAGAAPTVTYSTSQNVVPVGFVMSVTPQISDEDVVVLNVRPTVSKIVSFVNDPNPDLARAGVVSRIPNIQTREFETMLRVSSGQTAVLGGLMQDTLETSRDGLPMLARVPILGDAVSYRNDLTRKSELVIFLRPIVIKEASMDSDLAEYRKFLPDSQFFKEADPLVPELAPPYRMSPNPVVPEAKKPSQQP